MQLFFQISHFLFSLWEEKFGFDNSFRLHQPSVGSAFSSSTMFPYTLSSLVKAYSSQAHLPVCRPFDTTLPIGHFACSWLTSNAEEGPPRTSSLWWLGSYFPLQLFFQPWYPHLSCEPLWPWSHFDIVWKEPRIPTFVSGFCGQSPQCFLPRFQPFDRLSQEVPACLWHV